MPYFAEDPTYSGFTFSIDAETGEYVLAGAKNSITSAEIPALTKGQIVSVISNSAFSFYFSLQTVTMPQTITKIGDYAFSGCSSLTSISIPDSVTSIGDGAFSGCYGLTSLSIGSSVTSIGSGAFGGCSNLTSFTIPASVTSIGESAFGGCLSVTSIDVDSNNAYYCSIDGVLFDKDVTRLMQYPLSKTNTSYTIVASVKNIDSGAFGYGLRNDELSGLYLTSITFEITNNWYAKDIDSIDVSNPTTNATNLTAAMDYMNPNWSMKSLNRVDG